MIFSKTLEQTLSNALAEADKRRHEYATLEHLLVALVDDPHVADFLDFKKVDRAALRNEVAKYLDNDLGALVFDESLTSEGDEAKQETTPTSGFQRVVQRSILHVQSSGREEVNGLNVFVALFSERESFAVHFLNSFDLTRLDAVTYLSHGPSEQYGDDSNADSSEQSDSANINRIFLDDLKAVSDSIPTEPVLNTPKIASSVTQLCVDVAEQSALKPPVAGHRDALLTIGIYGPWGSGKSTLLRAIGAEMSKAGFVTVPINTWKWDGNEEIYTFVNRELLKNLSQIPGLRWRIMTIQMFISFQSNARRLSVWVGCAVALMVGLFWVNWPATLSGQDVAKGSLLAVGAGFFVAIMAKPIGSLIEKLIFQERTNLDAKQSLSKSYKYLDFVRRMTLKQKRAPLAFLFDDLDRCDNETVVRFVKSIHSLTADGSVSVVACDEEFASAAIYNHFKSVADYLSEGTDFGRRFLEKIVQIPFRLPEVSADDLVSLGLSPAERRSPKVSLDAADSPSEPEEKGDVTAAQHDSSMSENGELKVSEAKLTEISGAILRLVVEPCHVQIRQAKMLINMIKLYTLVFPPPNESSAERMATFLVVSYLEPNWIPNEYFETSFRITNAGLMKVRKELRLKLGDDVSALARLYRLFGIQFPNVHSASD